MTPIVRKNLLLISVSFQASDGSGTQPSAASMVLNYADTTKTPQMTTIPLVFDAGTSQWSATWDTSVAGPCTVTWVAYGTGPVEAATQGQFQIVANAPNLSVA